MSEIIRPMRCAVYTRKSTSEGLEQDFNSLDAQREACMAYITSQRGEGWTALDTHYDDGGFTGANTDRPGLQQLICDIKQGFVNCVVVYKVDRLSRSLLDFSQLLEFFDKHSVSFVSVTQNFNTKTSMGRLTLNILLSFAQFEREIISERTRDKMGASRMKGKFIGGLIPFGYRLDKERHVLVPNPPYDEQVRFMFESLLREENVAKVLDILTAKGICLPERKLHNGKVWPARPISRAYFYRIIHSPTYIGKVEYKGKIYEGEHEGLVPLETYRAVQDLLKTKRSSHGFSRKPIPGLLRGLLYCKECGSDMVPIYAKKNGRKHFYYLCHKCAQEGYASCPTKTVRQPEFNEAVLKQLAERGLINRAELEPLELDQQTEILSKVVRRITYAYQRENIEILLLNGVCFTFHAIVKPNYGRHIKRVKPAQNTKKVDRKTYHKALALQIREYMRVNNLSQKECAAALGMSPARVSQILRNT